MSLASLTATDFESHIGRAFPIEGNGTRVEMKLTAVERLGAARREGGAFSLLFSSTPGAFLPQAIYPVQHPELGTLDLFVVPLGPKDGANSYQVIFT